MKIGKYVTSHTISRLAILFLSLAWIGGTITFLVEAARPRFCFEACQLSDHDALASDHFILGSIACALVFPFVAAVICMFTYRKLGAALFLIFGVLPGLAYGGSVGVGAVHEIHRIDREKSVPPPANYCPCYSNGGCNCPGAEGLYWHELRGLTWSHVVAYDQEHDVWRPATAAGWDHDDFAMYVWRSVRAGGDTRTPKSRRTLKLPAGASTPSPPSGTT